MEREDEYKPVYISAAFICDYLDWSPQYLSKAKKTRRFPKPVEKDKYDVLEFLYWINLQHKRELAKYKPGMYVLSDADLDRCDKLSSELGVLDFSFLATDNLDEN
jgi:hypothetical protein